jgi:hypothetical protein
MMIGFVAIAGLAQRPGYIVKSAFGLGNCLGHAPSLRYLQEASGSPFLMGDVESAGVQRRRTPRKRHIRFQCRRNLPIALATARALVSPAPKPYYQTAPTDFFVAARGQRLPRLPTNPDTAYQLISSKVTKH